MHQSKHIFSDDFKNIQSLNLLSKLSQKEKQNYAKLSRTTRKTKLKTRINFKKLMKIKKEKKINRTESYIYSKLL